MIMIITALIRWHLSPINSSYATNEPIKSYLTWHPIGWTLHLWKWPTSKADRLRRRADGPHLSWKAEASATEVARCHHGKRWSSSSASSTWPSDSGTTPAKPHQSYQHQYVNHQLICIFPFSYFAFIKAFVMSSCHLFSVNSHHYISVRLTWI